MRNITPVLQFVLANLKLLQTIDQNNITSGLVQLHTILTGNSYGHRKIEQSQLISEMGAQYKRFIAYRKADSIRFNRELLRKVFYHIKDKSEVKMWHHLPVNKDISDMLGTLHEERHRFHDTDIVNHLNNLSLVLRHYMSNLDYRAIESDHVVYINDFPDKAINLIVNRKMDDESTVAMGIVLASLCLSPYQANADPDYMASERSYYFKRLSRFQDKSISNETIMCAGVSEIGRLAMCTDDTRGNISDEGKEVILRLMDMGSLDDPNQGKEM